jgi:hypothetical protein
MTMKLTEDMTEALTHYTGPVRHCRPGAARADKLPLPKRSDDANACGWAMPPPDLKAKRRARRRARAERQRIEANNRAVRKAMPKPTRQAEWKQRP